MSTSKFAETHNLVAFLEKPEESNSSGHLLRSKQLMRERQIQALIDKKKVIISETSIRSDLQLDDAEGTYCLPTTTIFAELGRMRYENLTQKLTFYKANFSSQWKFLIHTILQYLSAKITSWNEFSSTMASAIICLATNQKFNLSKYIFYNMVKNLDGGVKFLIYPRFVQVFLDKKVEGMSMYKGVYVTPSHTKKVFANIKRPCKGFSGRVTPLFSTMRAQATEDMGGCIIEDLDADAEGIEFEKVVEEPIVSVATTTKSIPVSVVEVVTTASASVEILDELTLAQTLIEIKTAKPKPVTTAATTVTSVRPRAKGIIFHDQEEQKKDQVSLNEEMARNLEAQLHAELIKEERLARQKEEEANIALIKSWDNTQAMMEADFELA
ncbi:hypothetical protein Tco_0153976 [Tanacetum coccineum]